MTKNRLEAFSDGVIAIIITIMVLELKVPHGHDLEALVPVVPVFLSYVLSFVFVGIYWNNHHHLIHAASGVDARIMWANLHLLFWMSLIPVSTGWMGEEPHAAWPAAMYGVVLLMAGVAYVLLELAIIARDGKDSPLAKALGRDYKGKASVVLYVSGVGLAFVQHWISIAIYVLVAVIWLIPDRRIEKQLKRSSGQGAHEG